MTINEIRDLVPGATLMRDGVIYTTLDADDDYRYDVTVAIMMGNEVLRISGFSSELKVASDRVSDAILFCNKHNKENSFAQVYYDMGDCDFNAKWFIDTELASKEGLRENMKLAICAIWNFFVEVGKEF